GQIAVEQASGKAMQLQWIKRHGGRGSWSGEALEITIREGAPVAGQTQGRTGPKDQRRKIN
ncbi:MAG: hypothetical protein WBX95_08810, partial [Xanthobacteraceae bacterium]